MYLQSHKIECADKTCFADPVTFYNFNYKPTTTYLSDHKIVTGCKWWQGLVDTLHLDFK